MDQKLQKKRGGANDEICSKNVVVGQVFYFYKNREIDRNVLDSSKELNKEQVKVLDWQKFGKGPGG